MSDYTKTTDFEAKDALASGNPSKLVKGSELETEFDNVATAIATKVDTTDAAAAGTAGIAELATQAEVDAGTDTEKIVTPATLAANASVGGSQRAVLLLESDRNNTETLTIDSVLQVTLENSARYAFKLVAFYDVDNAAIDGLVYDFDGGTSTPINFRAHHRTFIGSGAGVSSENNTVLPSTNVTADATDDASTNSIIVTGGFNTGVSGGGTFGISWAQEVATVADATLKVNSYLIVERLA